MRKSTRSEVAAAPLAPVAKPGAFAAVAKFATFAMFAAFAMLATAAAAATAVAAGAAEAGSTPLPAAEVEALPAPVRAPACAAASAAPVELVAPQPAAPLVAGSTAILEWAPLPGLDRLPAREEWEAFLSLDGGRTYTARITPHLDADLRRFRWQVPGMAANDARILLRFGDERRETAVALPQRFTIVAAPIAVTRGAALAAGPGEAARPRDAGVVAWTEGSRRGTGERQVVVEERELREGWRRSAPGRGPLAVGVRRSRPSPPAPRARAAAGPDGAGCIAAAAARRAPLPPIDRMLQTSRRNE